MRRRVATRVGSTVTTLKPLGLVRAARLRGWVSRVDEDWTVLALGIVTVVVAVGLGVIAFASAHDRDARLADAAAAQLRVKASGLDDRLTSDLFGLRVDEADLFRARVDAFAQEPASIGGGDPNTDLSRVENDLAEVNKQPDASPAVLADVKTIFDELPFYMQAEATAQAYNEQGLPVGAAYLREAAAYFVGNLLFKADDVRQVDQNRLIADDNEAAGLPLALIAADVLGIAALVATQVALARRTRRLFNPGAAAASVLVFVVVAWSVTAVLVSRNQVAAAALPHALSAASLANDQERATHVHLDDLVTLDDHGEDCSAATKPAGIQFTYNVTCSSEMDAITYLTTLSGTLSTELAAADASTAGDIKALRADVGLWSAHENKLPTLQNLAKVAAGAEDNEERYAPNFGQTISPYSQSDGESASEPTAMDYNALKDNVITVMATEWQDHASGTSAASDALSGLAGAALPLGFAAGIAAAAGFGWRLAEYWTTGRSGA